jgi:hypothetical protein
MGDSLPGRVSRKREATELHVTMHAKQQLA